MMTDLVWLLLPDTALPLALMVGGVGLLLGLLGWRAGWRLLGFAFLLPLGGLIADTVLGMVPLWMAILIAVWSGLALLRAVLSFFLGRHGAERFAGSLAAGVIRLVAQLLLLPLRLAWRGARSTASAGARRRTLPVAALIITMAAVLASPSAAEAGGLHRAVGRRVVRAAMKPTIRVLDLMRHRRVRPHPLHNPRTVFRYTTWRRAARELRHGIPAGHHLTATGGPGRPMTAWNARRRWGLPRLPQVRLTVRVPRGQPVRVVPVTAGKGHRYEMTSTRRIPRHAIRTVVGLKRGVKR